MNSVLLNFVLNVMIYTQAAVSDGSPAPACEILKNRNYAFVTAMHSEENVGHDDL